MPEILTLNASSATPLRDIRIIPKHLEKDDKEGGNVFVTIGLAETNVSILDDEGTPGAHWDAVFGWSFLFSIPFEEDGVHFYLEEKRIVERALAGNTRIYGKLRDTARWRAACSNALRDAVDRILRETVRSGAQYDRIVMSMPEWLLPISGGVKGLRMNMENEIEIEEI